MLQTLDPGQLLCDGGGAGEGDGRKGSREHPVASAAVGVQLPQDQGGCRGRGGEEERGGRDSEELQNPIQDQLNRGEREREREELNLYHHYQRMQ